MIDARWPRADPAALKQDQIELVVQVNGKLRGKVFIPTGADKAQVQKIALADANVSKHIGDKAVKKVIIIPGKLVNVVV